MGLTGNSHWSQTMGLTRYSHCLSIPFKQDKANDGSRVSVMSRSTSHLPSLSRGGLQHLSPISWSMMLSFHFIQTTMSNSQLDMTSHGNPKGFISSWILGCSICLCLPFHFIQTTMSNSQLDMTSQIKPKPTQSKPKANPKPLGFGKFRVWDFKVMARVWKSN